MAIVRPKEAYHQRTAQEMEKHFRTPEWTVRQKIALACRMLAEEGHESALAGQITARGEKPGTYWMLSFGLGFDEAQASNIVLCDDDLNLLEGDGMVVGPLRRTPKTLSYHVPGGIQTLVMVTRLVLVSAGCMTSATMMASPNMYCAQLPGVPESWNASLYVGKSM